MHPEKTRMLDTIIGDQYGNTTGIVVRKGGEVAYERYFNGYAANDAVHVYSVTKSIFSALIGIAIDKGCIHGVHQKVLDFFPDYTAPEGEEAIHSITLAHLLTMTAPYKCDTEPYEAFFESDNWMAFALNLLGGDMPTGAFKYSPIVGAHILSGILANATGQPILDFAAENLFSPLGIAVPHNVVLRTKAEHMAFGAGKNAGGWAVDPQGINTASWGLCLTPLGMAKIGQLYANRGMWEGRPIVSAGWIDQSTREHSRWAQLNLAYGYLWWILDGNGPTYAAMGDGGNVIYVNAQKQLVVAIAALFMPDAKDRIGLILEHIEPLFAD